MASITNAIRRYRNLLKSSFQLGASPGDSLKIFYWGAVKPSLCARNLGKHDPAEIIKLRVLSGGNASDIFIRDNGLDIYTVLEILPGGELNPKLHHDFEPQTIYDLGANIGISTLYLLNHFPQAQVVAFEPEPGNYAIASRNLEGQPRATLLERAVSNTRGVMNFTCGTDIRGGKLADEGASGEQVRQVQVSSIDEMVHEEGRPCPCYLKIDVEGAELSVLEGMSRSMGDIRVIFIETHSPELHESCRDHLVRSGLKIVEDKWMTKFGALWAVRA
ncbi:FkbM family methyltransferase [Luteolibacter flavescens]|uniref:FkbM family methyltransferase n=1 Tax=Luteolibacter flavescens TaxID=1859460 RepID=A0ABT3FNL8_9BACT|nr:FkbM family methyltransferase [Luteolibacter flavescens]MCW1885173.1 FkbM family methyltransferase [Luteolibacter flavescens]